MGKERLLVGGVGLDVLIKGLKMLLDLASELLKRAVVIFAELCEFLQKFRPLMRVLFYLWELVPHVLVKSVKLTDLS